MEEPSAFTQARPHDGPATAHDLQIKPSAISRIEGHEPALRALAHRLAAAVAAAGYSLTRASLFAEILHDEVSNDVVLVLEVEGFERREQRLELWEQLSDLISENDGPLISERLGLVVHGTEP